MLKIKAISCCSCDLPRTLDTQEPRFSWLLTGSEPYSEQGSYHIQVARDEDFSMLVWDSGEKKSNTSQYIRYEGELLDPCQRYWVQVRVRDSLGDLSDWTVSYFTTSMMLEDDTWDAPFISPSGDTDFASSAGWYLLYDVSIKKQVRRATVFATALGMYELYIHNERVGDQEFSPGWTAYEHRVQYQSYDVTDLLREGSNLLRAHLGTGWYKGDLGGWLGLRGLYGRRNWFSMIMNIEYEDGTTEQIQTDDQWRSQRSPVVYSELYHGEVYDARMEKHDELLRSSWDTLSGIIIGEFENLRVVYQQGPVVIPQEVLKPIDVLEDSSGRMILDFGQNMTGQVRVSIGGESGGSLRLLHAEILDAESDLYTENLRSARQTVEYICRGGENVIYKSHFTFQGFRYVLVEPSDISVTASDFEAVVYHSQMERGGYFSCSDRRVNRLFENIAWGMKGNFLDVPTDCPQRDERLGWTGDAQVFTDTACRLHDVSGFFRKWLADMRLEQHADGGIPHVIPDIFKYVPDEKREIPPASATGWADAVVIIPWQLYLHYGDVTFLSDNYDAMKSWVSYMYHHAEDGLIWDEGFHFGDWLALDAEQGSYFGATPNALVATAFYANSVRIVGKCAVVLGKEEDEREYHDLLKGLIKAFSDRFFDSHGKLTVQTQTAHVLALQFGLVPEPYIRPTVDALVQLLEDADMHLKTGFLGTPYLCDVLSSHGRTDIAYKLLLQDSYPSWLYQVDMGATTIWEHWDGIKPDGSLWSPDMNSFNHYAYGAVGAWILSVIAGINYTERSPGYRHIILTPHSEEGLDWVSASQETPYGRVSIRWEKTSTGIILSGEIPMNTTGSLQIPGSQEIIPLIPGFFRYELP